MALLVIVSDSERASSTAEMYLNDPHVVATVSAFISVERISYARRTRGRSSPPPSALANVAIRCRAPSSSFTEHGRERAKVRIGQFPVNLLSLGNRAGILPRRREYSVRSPSRDPLGAMR